jgi:hypothetical protein
LLQKDTTLLQNNCGKCGGLAFSGSEDVENVGSL